MIWADWVPFDTLLGKTLVSAEVSKEDYRDSIIFTTNEGEVFSMHHEQDCCEQVCLEDICGELSDLVNSPILVADESSNSNDYPSQTWTFYTLRTMKGTVTLRWYGSSNGYYSESVDLYKVG